MKGNGCRLIYDMIYLLTAIGLPPSGSSTVHIYIQIIHRTTQNKQYIEQHKIFGRVRAVPRLGELYPGICLTTEEKARKTLSQGSRTSQVIFWNLAGGTEVSHEEPQDNRYPSPDSNGAPTDYMS
jgi:hypothetical protein